MGTKKFENLEKKKYADIRAQIKTGDIFLSSGEYAFSQAIKHFSDSMFSHVAVVFVWNERVLLFESVEFEGVRIIPLSRYVNDYDNDGKGYNGRLFIGRYEPLIDETRAITMVGEAFDLLHRKYDMEEIGKIMGRLSKFGKALSKVVHFSDHVDNGAYICSEFVDVCFRKIGIKFKHDRGYIYPEHIASDGNVRPLFEIVS
jgi:hypothetical protein